MSMTSKKWRPAIVTVTASTVLALAGCSKSPQPETQTHNPPMPVPTNESTDPPAPPSNPPALQSWDDVASGHPANATNPPSPLLQLITDGRCYKQWYGGMMRLPEDTKSMDLGGKSYNVRILTDVDNSFGRTTAIQCPPDAAKVMADNKDKAVPSSKPTP